MRAIRTIGWAAAGFLPGVIVFVIPGFVESQGENLGLFFGGSGLAVAGALIGGIGGWERDPSARWRVALGAAGGLVLAVVLFLLIVVVVAALLDSEDAGILALVGVALVLLGPFVGAAVTRRCRRRPAQTQPGG